MAKNRYPGVNATVAVDPAGGAVFVAVGVARNITPPPYLRAGPVDLSGLEDTEAVAVPGAPQPSEFVFEFIYDPNETDDSQLITLYGNQAEANWRIQAVTTAGGTTVTWTETFLGRVRNIEPQNAAGDGRFAAVCTVTRSGAIVDAEA